MPAYRDKSEARGYGVWVRRGQALESPVVPTRPQPSSILRGEPLFSLHPLHGVGGEGGSWRPAQGLRLSCRDLTGLGHH